MRLFFYVSLVEEFLNLYPSNIRKYILLKYYVRFIYENVYAVESSSFFEMLIRSIGKQSDPLARKGALFISASLIRIVNEKRAIEVTFTILM